MDLLFIPLRWVHVLGAAAWLGEVVVINFVLLPILFRLPPGDGARFMQQVFPRVFRLASYLALTTILSGFVLALVMSRGQIELFLTTRWGRSILVGGTIGLLLALFHFFVEGRLEKPLAVANANPSEMESVYRVLRVVPRAGLGVILTAFVLMMYAVRGL
jgi:uncharacterized membrane protein